MARSPIRIRTKQGRKLTGSCTRAQASAFLTRRKVALNKMLAKMSPAQVARFYAMTPADQHVYSTKRGVPARDGNCTFQSAEYVLRFGGDTFAITKKPKAKAAPSKRAGSSNQNAVAPWWMRFGFDD